MGGGRGEGKEVVFALLMKMRTFFFLPKTKKDLPKRENKEKKDFLSCGGLGFFSDWDNQNNNS